MRGIVKPSPASSPRRGRLRLRSGEIHALLCENGAGKSTLMNVLDGLYRPEAGRVLVFGRPVDSARPRDAIAAGRGWSHQHFALVPTQTVTENVLIGLDRPRFRVDLGATTTRSPTWPAATPGGRPAVARLAAHRRRAVRVSILKML